MVKSYKYLGLTFSTTLSFSAAVEDMAVRAQKSTIEILATLNRIDCNSAEIFFKLLLSPLYCMERSYGGCISLTKLKGSICMPVNGFCMCSIKHRKTSFMENLADIPYGSQAYRKA